MSGMQWSFGFSCLFFLKTVWICQAFDADTPDPRVLSLDLTLVCSDDKSKQATLISYPVTFKGHVIKDMQIFCKNGWMQMTRGRGINMIRIHYPQTYTSVVPGACVFRGPYSVPTNDSIEMYNVSVALLWSDGTPTYESLECNVTKSQASNAPEPKASPTSSTPQPEAASHNQSKLIDWDVFCSQNENIPAKFISRLVAPKCLAVEKMDVDCSNGLVPITHEHGFNMMLIQYTRNKLLDSPGMCVFWGPYSVPKNDTVVLYTVTARLKWSEGPPTDLSIQCYMPKSPDAPKPESCLSSPPEPEASPSSNAPEPETYPTSSAPEKVYSDQPAPSHNQSKLIDWDVYCSQDESIQAKFISRLVTSKDQALEKTEINCSNGLVPITQEFGINMMLIQYTRNELLDSPGMCVFWGPYSVPKNDTVVLYTVTARLKWSEGPPTNLSIECYMPKSPVAPKPETGPTSNAPEPETYPTSSAPEKVSSDQPAPSHNQSKLIDWDVYCSQNESIPAKFISRLVTSKDQALEKTEINCSNGLVPITQEFGINMMLIQYTRNELLDSPGMCVFWGPYSVPKNDTVVLYTVTARLKWSEGPPTNLSIECYMPKSPVAPKPETGPTSNAPEPETYPTSSAPEKVSSDQAAPSHNQSKLIDWDVYCSQNESIPAKFISRLVTSKDQALEKTEINCSNGLVPITQEFGINMMLIQYTRNELLDSPGMCVFWGPYSVPKNDTVVLYTVTARLKWSEGPPTNLSIECYMPKSPVAPKPETGPSSNAPEPETYPTSSAPEKVYSDQPAPSHNQSKLIDWDVYCSQNESIPAKFISRLVTSKDQALEKTEINCSNGLVPITHEFGINMMLIQYTRNELLDSPGMCVFWGPYSVPKNDTVVLYTVTARLKWSEGPPTNLPIECYMPKSPVAPKPETGPTSNAPEPETYPTSSAPEKVSSDQPAPSHNQSKLIDWDVYCSQNESIPAKFISRLVTSKDQALEKTEINCSNGLVPITHEFGINMMLIQYTRNELLDSPGMCVFWGPYSVPKNDTVVLYTVTARLKWSEGPPTNLSIECYMPKSPVAPKPETGPTSNAPEPETYPTSSAPEKVSSDQPAPSHNQSKLIDWDVYCSQNESIPAKFISRLVTSKDQALEKTEINCSNGLVPITHKFGINMMLIQYTRNELLDSPGMCVFWGPYSVPKNDTVVLYTVTARLKWSEGPPTNLSIECYMPKSPVAPKPETGPTSNAPEPETYPTSSAPEKVSSDQAAPSHNQSKLIDWDVYCSQNESIPAKFISRLVTSKDQALEKTEINCSNGLVPITQEFGINMMLIQYTRNELLDSPGMCVFWGPYSVPKNDTVVLYTVTARLKWSEGPPTNLSIECYMPKSPVAPKPETGPSSNAPEPETYPTSSAPEKVYSDQPAPSHNQSKLIDWDVYCSQNESIPAKFISRLVTSKDQALEKTEINCSNGLVPITHEFGINMMLIQYTRNELLDSPGMCVFWGPYSVPKNDTVVLYTVTARLKWSEGPPTNLPIECYMPKSPVAPKPETGPTSNAPEPETYPTSSAPEKVSSDQPAPSHNQSKLIDWDVYCSQNESIPAKFISRLVTSKDQALEKTEINCSNGLVPITHEFGINMMLIQYTRNELLDSPGMCVFWGPYSVPKNDTVVLYTVTARLKWSEGPPTNLSIECYMPKSPVAPKPETGPTSNAPEPETYPTSSAPEKVSSDQPAPSHNQSKLIDWDVYCSQNESIPAKFISRLVTSKDQALEKTEINCSNGLVPITHKFGINMMLIQYTRNELLDSPGMCVFWGPYSVPKNDTVVLYTVTARLKWSEGPPTNLSIECYMPKSPVAPKPETGPTSNAPEPETYPTSSAPEKVSSDQPAPSHNQSKLIDWDVYCSQNESIPAKFISRLVTSKDQALEKTEINCSNGLVPITHEFGINMMLIQYTRNELLDSPGMCVFWGPYSVPKNDTVVLYTVTARLKWSEGPPTNLSIECYMPKSPVAPKPETGPTSNAPEPETYPTSSAPEKVSSDQPAPSHNQSKLIDWDVYCSQNESIPAKFISLVTSKDQALEKTEINCSNGLVPITHEFGINMMLIQYTRNELLDSPGMCVFWGPYSVPKNDTVVLYTVTARLKWSEGPPTNLPIECYMPKSPVAPKPETGPTSNAPEPETYPTSSAPEKVSSDQPAPSHNQSKLIDWDVYCSQNESIPAKFISRLVTSKDQALEKTEINCSNGLVPITQEFGINMMLIQYTRNELLDSPGMCVFWGPYSVPKNDTVVLYTVTARLKWSEGPPTNLSIECYMPKSPVAPKPETGPSSNAPEPETYPTSSAPEKVYSDQPAPSHNQSKLIDWDVYCSQNESIPAKFISRLVTSKDQALEKTEINCSNGLVPITQEFGINMMLIQYTRNELLDSPGMCVFWGPYSVPKNDTVVLYTVTARLKWSEGPPTNLSIECYMPKSPVAPKPETGPTSNAPEPETYPTSSAPEKVSSDQPAPSHNQSKLIDWDVYCSQNESFPAKFISRLVTSKDQALEKTEINCSNGLVPITQEFGINMMLIQYTRNELLDSPGMCVFWGPYSVPKNDTVVLYTVTARLKWSEGPPTNLSIECYMPKSPVASKPETGPTSNAPEPQTYPTSSAPEKVSSDQPAPSHNQSKLIDWDVYCSQNESFPAKFISRLVTSKDQALEKTEINCSNGLVPITHEFGINMMLIQYTRNELLDSPGMCVFWGPYSVPKNDTVVLYTVTARLKWSEGPPTNLSIECYMPKSPVAPKPETGPTSNAPEPQTYPTSSAPEKVSSDQPAPSHNQSKLIDWDVYCSQNESIPAKFISRLVTSKDQALEKTEINCSNGLVPITQEFGINMMLIQYTRNELLDSPGMCVFWGPYSVPKNDTVVLYTVTARLKWSEGPPTNLSIECYMPKSPVAPKPETGPSSNAPEPETYPTSSAPEKVYSDQPAPSHNQSKLIDWDVYCSQNESIPAKFISRLVTSKDQALEKTEINCSNGLVPITHEFGINMMLIQYTRNELLDSPGMCVFWGPYSVPKNDTVVLYTVTARLKWSEGPPTNLSIECYMPKSPVAPKPETGPTSNAPEPQTYPTSSAPEKVSSDQPAPSHNQSKLIDWDVYCSQNESIPAKFISRLLTSKDQALEKTEINCSNGLVPITQEFGINMMLIQYTRNELLDSPGMCVFWGPYSVPKNDTVVLYTVTARLKWSEGPPTNLSIECYMPKSPVAPKPETGPTSNAPEPETYPTSSAPEKVSSDQPAPSHNQSKLIDWDVYCSQNESIPAKFISRLVTSKDQALEKTEINCSNGLVPITHEFGINMMLIQYTRNELLDSPGMCVFWGPYSVPKNDTVVLYTVTARLKWSEGPPTNLSIECYMPKSPVAPKPETGPTSNAPEPETYPTSSAPEKVSSDQPAPSHNQSKLIDWDVYCSQNESIPAKFISRLVTSKDQALEKTEINCSNGLVPITQEFGINMMLIQYTRNELLDSPGMCVFWGPYSVPKNDTVVLYTVTARLKWSEGPPTNLSIECYMPKSPVAPKPETGPTSNAPEPQTYPTSSAPEKVSSDQPAPSHNQSKLIDWDVYCSQNESIPAKFISRLVTSKDQALEKTEINCSNGLVPITQEFGINMMLIQYTRNELLDSPGMCVFWGPYSVPKNDTVVLYTVTARLKWSEGPPTNLSIECYMPKSPVAPKPETGPTSNAPEPQTYPTSSAPEKVSSDQPAPSHNQSKLIDWDVYCSQNESIPAKFISRLVTSKDQALEKTEINCSNGLVPITHEFGINMMLIQYTRNELLDSPGMCVFWGPYSVPKNDTVVLYTVTARLKWSEGPPTNLSIECYMPKSPVAPKPETGPTSNAPEPETYPTSSAPGTSPEGSATAAPGTSPEGNTTAARNAYPRKSNQTTSTEDVLDDTSNYIIKVIPHCRTRGDVALIEIITDVDLSAVAVCSNGSRHHFNSTDFVHFYLPVSYNVTPSVCAFTRSKANLFKLHIGVSWKDRLHDVTTQKKDFLITCTFDPHKSHRGPTSASSEPLIAAKEIQSHQGPQSDAEEVFLKLVDIRNETLAAAVPLSKKVRLVGEVHGSSLESGLKPVACDAVGVQQGQRYAILRDGCGDGIVFAKDIGFITEGNKAFSPVFEVFKLHGNLHLTFMCNFTLCTHSCDGSSCSNQRRTRRSMAWQDIPHVADFDSSATPSTDMATVQVALLVAVALLITQLAGLAIYVNIN
ncbi:vitelline envelope sperm lysin receptor isoform X2 [Haliotis rufescens]|uniref:vitelline envelope sperm lysin receptor isoform X2 n=1 Tax=Haliotis rufescens TaxID=6454 RepID=UPI00201F4251|nr:vitelline envelope sperm lysin receptor isoform X2 [Haliotis rufescens]